MITVGELIEKLKSYSPDATLRFSVDNESNPDDEERVFCENGISGHFGNENEVTICLVGRSNLE